MPLEIIVFACSGIAGSTTGIVVLLRSRNEIGLRRFLAHCAFFGCLGLFGSMLAWSQVQPNETNAYRIVGAFGIFPLLGLSARELRNILRRIVFALLKVSDNGDIGSKRPVGAEDEPSPPP